MRQEEIKVYCIAKSGIIKDQATEWLTDLGVSDEATKRILNDAKTSAERIVEMAGRRCYKSFEPGLNPNVTKIREDIGVYIENILSVGHGSVIEGVTFTFAIENVTRVFTGEMNRHRAGMAISEGSMRYIRYTDIPYWEPISIRQSAADTEEIRIKKLQTREVFERAFLDAENHYKELLKIWEPELNAPAFKQKKEITSMMRRIIPMGTCTGGVWSGNLRALRHIFEMRCSPAAEEEILHVACMMLDIMRELEPNFFKDFEKVEGFWQAKYKKV